MEIGLSTNTAYGRFVTATVGGTEGGLSNGATTYTLAMPPVNSTLVAVTTTSIAMNWSANTNPAGTRFNAQLSLISDFSTVTATSATLNAQAVFPSLTSNATYYLRVQAQNGNAVATAYDLMLTTVTPAAIPVSGSFTTVTPTSVGIAWSGDTNAAGTLYQAELSTISLGGAAVATLTTSGFALNFTGLSVDTTYYARVKALGWAGVGMDSAYLLIGSQQTPLVTPAGLDFTQVYYSSVTLTWQDFASPNLQYIVQISTGGPFAIPDSSQTALSTATFTGLTANQFVQARVEAINSLDGNVSAWSATITTYTLANVPINLSSTSVAQTSVGLQWGANGNPAGTSYQLERSTDGINFTPVVTQTELSFTDIALLPGTVYQYRVRALNGAGAPTAYDGPIQVQTLGSPIMPKRPIGLWGERVSAGVNTFTVTFHWRPVTQRTDGSALTNLAGYQVYTTQNLLSARETWTLKTVSPTENWPTTVPSDAVTYYTFRTIDTSGLVSDWSDIMDDSVDLNHIFVASDNTSRAVLPQAPANALRREFNNYGADLTLTWTDLPADETGRVVRSMECQIMNEETNNPVTDLFFNPALLRVVMAYAVQNGQVVAGAPAVPPASNGAPSDINLLLPRVPVISAAQADTQLSLFWYDGNEWSKVGGQVDSADTTLSLTGNHGGRFQIRAATRPGLTLTRVYPRIFTPNGDGWNDKVIFLFDNPELVPISGKVYDISGSFVANLQTGPNPDSSLECGRQRPSRRDGCAFVGDLPVSIGFRRRADDGNGCCGEIDRNAAEPHPP